MLCSKFFFAVQTRVWDSSISTHSGGEWSLGETKYIIGDSYTVGKVWASTFGINWRKNWPLGAFWENAKIAFFASKIIFEVRIKPSCDYTFRAGPNLMWSSSRASNYDDFLFFWIFYCSSRTPVTAVWSSVNICWLKFQQILTKLPTAVTRVLDEQ